MTLDPPRLSVLVISRSASGVSVSVSVALLRVRYVGDVAVLVTPAGGVTVAVFDNVPVADDAIVGLDRVGDRAAGRQVDVGVVDAAAAAGVKPVAPPVAVAVNVAPVSGLGNVSTIEAPVTSLGPALVTTIVYVIPWPGTAVPIAP